MRIAGIGDNSPAVPIILVPEDGKAIRRKSPVNAVRSLVVDRVGLIIVRKDLKGLLNGLGVGPGIESCGRSIPPVLHDESRGGTAPLSKLN